MDKLFEIIFKFYLGVIFLAIFLLGTKTETKHNCLGSQGFSWLQFRASVTAPLIQRIFHMLIYKFLPTRKQSVLETNCSPSYLGGLRCLCVC